MGNVTCLITTAQQKQELAQGRHRVLLNELAKEHHRIHRSMRSGYTASLLFQAYQVIAEQEIELRQAIADKCARPMVETL